MMKKIFTFLLFAVSLSYAQGSGTALSFDGTSNYVGNIGAVSNFTFVQNTGVFTLESWVQFNNLTANDVFAILGNTGATAERGFVFGYENRSGVGTRELRFLLLRGTPGTPIIDARSPSDVVPDNDWHHIAVVGNGSTVTFYVDGVAYAGSGTMGSLSTGNASRTLRLGHDHFTPYLNGSLDEVRVWNRALSQDELRHKMTERLSGSEPGLVAYYRMDEGADNTCGGSTDVCDATGNGNHGTKF